MSWSIEGTYFETCSCELMCPCNFSFDHGATYDYCRVTLVFDIREGEIEGTDVSGRTLARDCRHAEGHDRGQLASRDVRRRRRIGRADGEAHGCLRRPDGRPHGRPRTAHRRGTRCRTRADHVVEEGLSHSVRIGDAIDFEVEDIVPFGIETGEPARLTGVFHPVASELTAAEAKRSKISAFGIEYEGKTGLSSRVLLGRLEHVTVATHDGSSRSGRARPRLRGRAHPARTRRVALGARGCRLVVDRTRDEGHGRRPVDRARNRRLVPRRVGRDDGRDDVPLGRADRRALLEAEAHASSRCPALFTSGYLLVWSAVGLLAYLLARSGHQLFGDALAWDRAGRWVAGAILLLAAAYELTPLKDVCLGKCRTPLGFLLGSWRDGLSGAMKMGARHGAWCVGCCWALMASLFALGVMSVVWMAVVAGLIAFEKLIPSRRGSDVWHSGGPPRSRGAHARAPDVLPALTIPGTGSMSQMNQMSP